MECPPGKVFMMVLVAYAFNDLVDEALNFINNCFLVSYLRIELTTYPFPLKLRYNIHECVKSACTTVKRAHFVESAMFTC